MKACSYCITINNPSNLEKDLYSTLPDSLQSQLVHAIAGYEVGQNNRPHVQGALIFSSPISDRKLRKSFPRAHIEPVKTTYARSVNYCQKEGTWTEWGDLMAALQLCSSLRDSREYPIYKIRGYNCKRIFVNNILTFEKKSDNNLIDLQNYANR